MSDVGIGAAAVAERERTGAGRRWLPVADNGAWFAVVSAPVRRPPGSPGWVERSPHGRAGDSVGVCLRPGEGRTP